MSKVSVLILAKNEQNNIGDCIKSCSFADEIVIIDDFSEDGTRDIAESLGARVVQRSLNGNWGEQRTFAVQQAQHEWIFFLDSDERCTPELAAEIRRVVDKNEKYGYWIRRINHFRRQVVRYGPLSPDWVCRLMPATGCRSEGRVHEKIIHAHQDKKLEHPMLHYTYETWDQYLRKMNQYSTLSAERYFSEGRGVSFIGDIILKPAFAFLKMYILKKGFLDGMLGYVFCKNYANYTMNKYVKLKYLLDGKNRPQ